MELNLTNYLEKLVTSVHRYVRRILAFILNHEVPKYSKLPVSVIMKRWSQSVAAEDN